MKFKKIFWFIGLVSFLFFSCNIINGTKKLGDGYFFDTELIIYTEKEFYDGGGYSVIPEKILSYAFDDNFIIVSSLKHNHEEVFWIIDKKKEKREIQYIESNEDYNGYYQYSNISGPMEKSEFIAKKKELGITLKFK